MSHLLSLFLTDPTQAILLVVGIAAALLSCFLGYPMMKFWIGVAGFCGGYAAASSVAAFFSDSTPVQVLAGFLFGVLCLVLTVLLYRVGIFLLCALLAFVSASLLLPGIAVWICAIFAVAVGVLAVFLIRPLVIITTSVQGALSALAALFTLCGWEQGAVIYLLAIPLCVLGMMSQFALSRKKKNEKVPAPAGGPYPPGQAPRRVNPPRAPNTPPHPGGYTASPAPLIRPGSRAFIHRGHPPLLSRSSRFRCSRLHSLRNSCPPKLQRRPPSRSPMCPGNPRRMNGNAMETKKEGAASSFLFYITVSS